MPPRAASGLESLRNPQHAKQRPHKVTGLRNYAFLSVSLILGAPAGVAGTSSSSSSIGTIGGLVASGDGPWEPAKPSEAPGRSEFAPPGEKMLSDPDPDPAPKVKLLPVPVGDVAGGDAAEAVGRGGVPWLNSAQRGHLRFVSG